MKTEVREFEYLLKSDATGSNLSRTPFAMAIRDWATDFRRRSTVKGELLTLHCACEQVQRANERAEVKVDLPLLPHLAGLSMRKEIADFSSAITGNRVKQPCSATKRLLARLLGDRLFEFSVDESKILHVGVKKLLKDLRDSLSEVSFRIVGKFGGGSDLGSPLYFIRVQLASEPATNKTNQESSNPYTLAEQKVLKELVRCKRTLGLDFNTTEINVGAETFNRKELARLKSKGLKPVFYRPSHWLTFGLTGKFRS
jgi:hypothetical protein